MAFERELNHNKVKTLRIAEFLYDLTQNPASHRLQCFHLQPLKETKNLTEIRDACFVLNVIAFRLPAPAYTFTSNLAHPESIPAWKLLLLPLALCPPPLWKAPGCPQQTSGLHPWPLLCPHTPTSSSAARPVDSSSMFSQIHPLSHFHGYFQPLSSSPRTRNPSIPASSLQPHSPGAAIAAILQRLISTHTIQTITRLLICLLNSFQNFLHLPIPPLLPWSIPSMLFACIIVRVA